MKFARPLKLSALVFGGISLLSSVASATTYNGNGNTGFAGAIGNSVLTITSTGTTVDFSLATTGFTGNGLAIYIDSVTGGFNSTSTFTDNADNGRLILSGLGANGRTLAQFPAGFNADFGLAVEPGNFAGLFQLAGGTSFTFLDSANLDAAATTTLNFSVPRSDLGLPATGGSFTFLASLISTTGYRSNETIGTSVTLPDPTNLGTAPNAGFTGTTTFSLSNTFVPEPSTWAAMLTGVALLGGAQYFRRVRRA